MLITLAAGFSLWITYGFAREDYIIVGANACAARWCSCCSASSCVIYYTDGQVPQSGIVILGRVTGDVSIFDRAGPVTVRIESAPK